jgi:hypothetical protein
MDFIALFADRMAAAVIELKGLKKRDAAFSTFRLVAAAMAIVCIYLAVVKDTWQFYVASGFLAIGFISLIIRHRQLRETIVYVKSWIAVNQDEFNYVKGDLSSFETGKEFSEPAHEFSEDLDLFATKGLFPRLNRLVTDAARVLLATRLKKNEMVDVETKQEAVKDLVPKLDFRHAFLAEGQSIEKEPGLKQRIKDWAALDSSFSFFLKPVVLWVFSLSFIGMLAVLIAIGGLASAKYLAVPFFLNLYILSRHLKRIKLDRSYVDSLAKSFSVRGKMIGLIENEGFESKELEALKAKLNAKNKQASQALIELGRLLSKLDSLDNAFGASMINGICLYHLHVMNSLLQWKHRYAKDLNEWLDVIAEFDYWISLAGYAHKHPDFTYPEINSQLEFQAENIGHPFIEQENRISNSLLYNGFDLVILTGSNMAGKSTFLRTIGVNLVLTKLGLPVCADRLVTKPYQLLTSMKPQDSLAGNESYFQAEVNRLRNLVDSMQTGTKSFVLLDEILRGTNSQDKRNGTMAFLKKIKAYDIVGIIATHDIEITDLTATEPNIFSNKFFESHLRNDELVFDYKLRDGVCETPNASDLMRIKGII